MKNLTIFLISLFILGCSSKEQTNPLPNKKNFYFPNQNNSFETKILSCESYKYENVVREFFGKNKILAEKNIDSNTQKTIWDIGRQKGFYDDKK